MSNKNPMRAIPKELRDVVAKAVRDGWTFEPGNHSKLRRGSALVVISGTPSNPSRVRQHLLHDLAHARPNQGRTA